MPADAFQSAGSPIGCTVLLKQYRCSKTSNKEEFVVNTSILKWNNKIRNKSTEIRAICKHTMRDSAHWVYSSIFRVIPLSCLHPGHNLYILMELCVWDFPVLEIFGNLLMHTVQVYSNEVHILIPPENISCCFIELVCYSGIVNWKCTSPKLICKRVKCIYRNHHKIVAQNIYMKLSSRRKRERLKTKWKKG